MTRGAGFWRSLPASSGVAGVLLMACRDGTPATHATPSPSSSASSARSVSNGSPEASAAAPQTGPAKSITLAGAAQGCGDLFLFRATASGDKIVTVRVDAKAL